MKTISEYKEIIESHRDAYEPEQEVDRFVVITVDSLNSSPLTPSNIAYHSISKYVDRYFTQKGIETLIVPPLLGRGATGGGFDLIFFLTTHATFILAFIRTVPILINIVRNIKKYKEHRRYIENQKKFRKNRSSVALYLQVIVKSDKSYKYANNNRDSLVSLLGMMPDLHTSLSEKYGHLTFRFYLSAGIEGSLADYTINLTDVVPTQQNIGEVFRHMDKRYVSDQDNLIFTFIQGKTKPKVKSVSNSSDLLLPI